MRKLITLLFITLLVISTSCKKEAKSKTELLSGKFWKMTELTINPSLPLYDNYGNLTGYTSDLFAQMLPCQKDDVVKYASDGTYVWDAKIKCDDSEVQSGTGTWMFNSEETVITQVESGVSMSYTIIELSASKLKFRYDTVVDGVTYQLTVTSVPE